MEAKILFYNHASGEGLIITREREKFGFAIENWNDFDSMPNEGMLVSAEIEHGEVVSLESLGNGDITTTSHAMRQESEESEAKQKSTVAQERITTIHLTLGVKQCIRQYFMKIEEDIGKRIGFKKTKYKLDFLKMRRFLFTTYNNLTELDMHFITPRIKAMRDDLLEMAQVYDDYKAKATYPEIAYEKVFLNRQEEYMRVYDEAQTAKAKLDGLRSSEEQLAEELHEREEVLKTTLRNSPIYVKLEDEYKEIKGDYVDTVHMIGELDTLYHEALKLMLEFERQYKEEFFNLFSNASKHYKKRILDILDAQSYLFDEQLWLQAQKSKVIQHFFDEAHIEGEYCSKTFLKYYLNTLDETKISQEQRELFALYEYLEKIDHVSIVILVGDIDDAFLFKSHVSKTSIEADFKIFDDFKKAYSWLQRHRATLLIVDKDAGGMSGETFVQKAKEKLGIRAKCIALYSSKSDLFDGEMRKSFKASDFQESLEKFLAKDDS